MTRPRISILMYHQVGEFQNITRLKANYCNVVEFERQMRFLHRWKYNVISLTDAVKGLKGEISIPVHSVVITFDDGYRNFYDYAFPVLKRYNFPAIVYVVAGQLGGKSHWLNEADIEAAQLMSLEQIRNVQDSGIEIGSHTVNHYRLTRLQDADLHKELFDSRKILEDKLQNPIDHICYPYGDHNEEVVKMAREVGYVSGVTTIKGSATSLNDALALPRKTVSFKDTPYRFWRNLHFKHGLLADNIIQNPIAAKSF